MALQTNKGDEGRHAMAQQRTETVEVIVDAATQGMRVDRLIRHLAHDMPLSRIHAMIRKGGITGASGRLKANDRLASGDTIRLKLSRNDADAVRKALEKQGDQQRPASSECAIPILFEDDHVLVFDKPAGVAAHPGSGHAVSETLFGALLEATGTSRDAAFRPGLVGRLDRDTSGVQLAGKTPVALRGLEKQSRDGRIHKVYLALVRNRHLKRTGRIDAPLVDVGSGPKRMRAVAAGSDPEAVAALTEYATVVSSRDAALVEVRPQTGRQHQIRAHFCSLGAPLAGDVRYGNKGWNGLLSKSAGLRRLFLHCRSIEFRHPVTDKTVAVASPLPNELSDALESVIPDADAPL